MSVATSEATVRHVPTGDKLAPRRHVTAAEYLAEDDAAERESELVNSEMILREGASQNHVRITVNLICEFGRQIGDRDYFFFVSQMRLRAGDNYHYPDAGIVCGNIERDPKSNALTNPAVLIEVLSDSTETVDRGVKLRHYRRLPSLRTYLLGSQNITLVEQYERGNDAGDWRILETEGLEGTVFLPAIDCRLPMSAIYRRVTVADDSGDTTDDAPATDEPAA